MKYFILVTGASTGIGFAATRTLLQAGYHILAGVRKASDAAHLSETFGPALHPLILDVTREDEIADARTAAERIIGEGRLVAIVNNAGIAIHGAVLYIPLEAWKKQFDVNLFGAISVTQHFFPLLSATRQPGDQHPSRIINLSSVSGLFASPFLGPYASSKFALEAMSDSLRRELYMHDVQVVLIEPGNIRTPMWDKAKTERSYFGPEYEGISAYKNRIIDNNISTAFSPEAMDDLILKTVRQRRVRPRYLIRPNAWKFNLIRRLPVSWVDNMILRKLRSRTGIRPF